MAAVSGACKIYYHFYRSFKYVLRLLLLKLFAVFSEQAVNNKRQITESQKRRRNKDNYKRNLVFAVKVCVEKRLRVTAAAAEAGKDLAAEFSANHCKCDIKIWQNQPTKRVQSLV